MAQFQILYSPTEADWRPITTEFSMEPFGDQQYIWPSFEEADAVRKRLLGRYPQVRLRIAVEDPEPGAVDWQTREKLRFGDGTYAETPWHCEEWYQAVHAEHFCHLSKEQHGKIAFTENSAKGLLDRQLVMSPGRYLHRYFSQVLGNEDIETWCARLSVLLAEHALKITQDADEIEEVYVGGPCSCMAHPADDFDSSCHPVRVYAGPDIALAYIGAREDARARSIIWPDRKIYTTIYGDVSRLRLLLEAEGYTEGGLNGARIQRIVDDDSFVVPYIDGGDDLCDDGQFLIIGRGSICSENTNGLGRVPWYCPRCENDARAYDEVWFSDGSSEEWCSGCWHHCTTYCEHNEQLYSDAEDFVTVFAEGSSYCVVEVDAEAFGAVYLEDRGEWWIRDQCRSCDGSGAMFHLDDLTEYYGEWLSEDCLPEPFDDDDPDLPNAHVIALRRRRLQTANFPGEPPRSEMPGCTAATLGVRKDDADGCPVPEEATGAAAPTPVDDPDRGPAPIALIGFAALPSASTHAGA